MTMNINEKKALYAFGCPNHEATIKRLRMLTALTPDPKTKKFFYNLSVKLSEDGVERWYSCFYYNMRLELESTCFMSRKFEP